MMRNIPRQLYRFYRMIKYSILLRKNLVSNQILCANKPRVSKKNTVLFKGSDVYIGHHCHIGANLIIGNKVLIASNVAFVGGDHDFSVVGRAIKDNNRSSMKTIVIGDDVWIGHGVTIMHGVTLHEGSIIAAGSVVTKDVAPFTIVAGNPAKKIKDRFSAEEIDLHKKELGMY